MEYQGFPQCFPSHAPRVLVQGCADYPLIRTSTAEGGRALLAALVLMLYCSGGLAAEPRVLVLNEANAPPYSNSERTGFFDVIAIEAFRRARLELNLAKLPAERALLLSNSGVADGELNRWSGIETQYPNLIRVPEKLGDWHFAAFSKDASIPGNIEAIRGRTVGFIRGWKIYREKLLPCLEGGVQ